MSPIAIMSSSVVSMMNGIAASRSLRAANSLNGILDGLTGERYQSRIQRSLVFQGKTPILRKQKSWSMVNLLRFIPYISYRNHDHSRPTPGRPGLARDGSARPGRSLRAVFAHHPKDGSERRADPGQCGIADEADRGD